MPLMSNAKGKKRILTLSAVFYMCCECVVYLCVCTHVLDDLPGACSTYFFGWYWSYNLYMVHISLSPHCVHSLGPVS